VSELRIGIIVGSTRPGRKGDQVARWVLEQASQRDDATYELVDLADFALPHLDEPMPPAMQNYANDHTKAWSAAIASYDGFVFVTPEYNHSTSGALKNAIDFLYAEWNNKAAGFVSYGYGASGGTRAAEHLRLIVGELQIADVRQQVSFSIANDFESNTTLVPSPQHEKQLATLLGQVVSWSRALHGLRIEATANAA
jgi:NAD(P)H-dependent FMN reductase